MRPSGRYIDSDPSRNSVLSSQTLTSTGTPLAKRVAFFASDIFERAKLRFSLTEPEPERYPP